MASTLGKLYSDQLYGTKVLSPLAIAVMDTPEFGRLAGLKQLGFTDVLFRGARHKRLEHSVGTYFISRTIMRRIVQNHERLALEHPGSFVSPKFRLMPSNAGVASNITTFASRWRGAAEVISIAALLHDIGHVPFGHTLEDEFVGLYERHDSLAGPRLHELLFNDASELAALFSDAQEPWLEGIGNNDLRRLIYLILSWKEDVSAPSDFVSLVDEELKKPSLSAGARSRLTELKQSHADFSALSLFHPFMCDIVGNTICADLLDYLPRDRMNLGMESRLHTRLQRYFTIRNGTLYAGEGLRLSIMVTRKGKGGQRRDVATSVLDIMRERYEMAERVFYHHKKAAASAVLAKLVELAIDAACKPRDDDSIYPAPWQDKGAPTTPVPHMVHLADEELIDYLGACKVDARKAALQRRLHRALRYRRKDLYRTLLVIDPSLLRSSKYSLAYFAREMRGPKGAPQSERRKALETELASAAGVSSDDVVIYCPAPSMQSKEVNARLEIDEGRVLPLSEQRESFAYHADVEVLRQYYKELWRAYVFVAPAVFASARQCQAIVDAFCERYAIPYLTAYGKVRTHEFTTPDGVTARQVVATVQTFVKSLPFKHLPVPVINQLLSDVTESQSFAEQLRSGDDTANMLSHLLNAGALQWAEVSMAERWRLSADERRRIADAVGQIRSGSGTITRVPARGMPAAADFPSYAKGLAEEVLERPIQDAHDSGADDESA